MDTTAFNFQTLNPDTIIDALWDTGLRVDSGLTALNSYENRVYQFSDEERRRYVVKFYRPQRWSREQIEEEHQFALELQQDEVPLAPPLMLNGKTLHQHDGFWFAIFPSLGGRQYETDNDDSWKGSDVLSPGYISVASGSFLSRVLLSGWKNISTSLRRSCASAAWCPLR